MNLWANMNEDQRLAHSRKFGTPYANRVTSPAIGPAVALTLGGSPTVPAARGLATGVQPPAARPAAPTGGIRITTAEQGAGADFDAGARSWNTTDPFKAAQLRALEQGSRGNMAPYGSLAPDSITNQRRASLGLAPLTMDDATANGMGANGAQQGMSGAARPSRYSAPAGGGGITVTPGRDIMGNPDQGYLPGGSAPATNGMGANGAQVAAQPGGSAPGGVQGSLGGTPTIPGGAAGALSTGGVPAGALSTGGVPSGGGFEYRGVGPEGNAVFIDPNTGEQFTFEGDIGENYELGQSYQLPSATPRTGLIGSEEALRGGLNAGLSAVQLGTEGAAAALTGANEAARGDLEPFSSPGGDANALQAALTGALGPAAQAEAMANYENSPGFDYLLDESERAIRRNAAATGGLGGGNVQRALQENAIGLAAQDFQNNFDRLGTISDRGLTAARDAGGYNAALGSALSGNIMDSSALAANMAYGTGRDMSAGRTRAGELIADNIANTASGVAGIRTGSGDSMSNTIGQGSNFLAQLLSTAGAQDATQQNQLATLLANLASGAGSQVAGLPGLGQTSQTQGILNSSNMTGTAMALAMLSDRRLKTNIKKLGEINGVNVYSWDWTDQGLELGGVATFGVLAQEVPHATVQRADGFLEVDYARVW